MSEYETLYRCWQCDSERWLPERPLSPAPKAKVSCESCRGLRTWRPVGSGHPRDLLELITDD